jgi:NAD(P)-dependent dehydrogenase (short-subunit alcohol dehydrogenase family)
MNINQLVIFGSTSSIAKALLPNLNIEPNHIFSVDRVNSKQNANGFIPRENQFRLDWDDVSEIEKFIATILNERLVGPVLVLNFMGYFGQIERIEDLDIADALTTNSKNLLPFLLLAKHAKLMPPGTRIISFSGAGVGGDNLDDSSLGYLAAKASMALLAESIDQQLARYEIRFGLIAPGAFPSRMQAVVAQEDSRKIPELRISRAKEVMSSNASTEKLAHLVGFLADNPDLLGGRTWSANFDVLTDQQGNFGRLRRFH